MSRRHGRAGSDRDKTDVRTLEMMLDYAIIEGAELRLPLFVLLLRTARLELMTSIGAHGGLGDRRVETKIKDCFARVDSGLFAAIEGSQGRPNVIQDR